MFPVFEFCADVDIIDAGRQDSAPDVEHVAGGLNGFLEVVELLGEGRNEEVADVVVFEDAGFLLAVGEAVVEDPEETG